MNNDLVMHLNSKAPSKKYKKETSQHNPVDLVNFSSFKTSHKQLLEQTVSRPTTNRL
jgi:hypothetical protein